MSKRIYTREEIRLSLVKGVNKELGICETIRMVYDDIYDLPASEWKEHITEHLVDALWMGKKMADRLAFYYETYHDKTGSWGEHLIPQSGNMTKKRRNRTV